MSPLLFKNPLGVCDHICTCASHFQALEIKERVVNETRALCPWIHHLLPPFISRWITLPRKRLFPSTYIFISIPVGLSYGKVETLTSEKNFSKPWPFPGLM